MPLGARLALRTLSILITGPILTATSGITGSKVTSSLPSQIRVPVGESEFYGKVSGVGERTYGAPPTVVAESASSFKQEDLYVGQRSGTSVGPSENLLDFTVGRAPYTIGHGFLVWDGSGEGAHAADSGPMPGRHGDSQPSDDSNRKTIQSRVFI